ncbi:hypothetical protein J1N35_028098 [Gossypium stocksii]|uniref:Dirigent protein n=1 Tax=Gossypium stocksii TaxID=47602 RepID=A0A9D3ZQS5_9ROSI|nr:hypothetical protein J1N35_028098 [Gossypium stocksii]
MNIRSIGHNVRSFVDNDRNIDVELDSDHLPLPSSAVQSQYYTKTLPYHPRPVKVIKLHFFMHEHTDVTAVQVAQVNITSNDNNSSVPFASLVAFNDPLRTAPETDSEVIGNV